LLSPPPAPSARHMLCPLSAVLIWAENMVVTKLAASVIEPAVIGFYRWVLAALVLTPFILPGVWQARRTIAPNLGKLAVLGALGTAMSPGLMYVGGAETTGNKRDQEHG